MVLLLAIELLDELVGGTRAAAWPLIRHDLGLTYVQIGLVLAVPGLVGSALDPIVGALGDSPRRRAAMVVGGIGFAVSAALAGLAPSFAVLLIALLIGNPATGAFVSLAQATLMDAEPKERVRNMARWTLAGSVGYVAGPVLLAVALWMGLGWRGLSVALALCALPLVFGLRRLPAGHHHAPSPLLRRVGSALAELRRGEVRRRLATLEAADLLLDVFHGFLALYFVDVVGTKPVEGALAVALWTGASLVGDALLLVVLRVVDGDTYLRWSAAITLVLYPGVPGATGVDREARAARPARAAQLGLVRDSEGRPLRGAAGTERRGRRSRRHRQPRRGARPSPARRPGRGRGSRCHDVGAAPCPRSAAGAQSAPGSSSSRSGFTSSGSGIGDSSGMSSLRSSSRGASVFSSDMRVILPDQSELQLPDGSTGLDAAAAIGPKLAEQAVLLRSNGHVRDLRLPLEDGQEIEILTTRDTSDPDALAVLRHSSAHLLAEAVRRLYPGVKIAIGPPIENGFYYDFEFPEPIAEEDLARIEEEIRRELAEGRAWERHDISRDDARRRFEGEAEPYKVELVGEGRGADLALYAGRLHRPLPRPAPPGLEADQGAQASPASRAPTGAATRRTRSFTRSTERPSTPRQVSTSTSSGSRRRGSGTIAGSARSSTSTTSSKHAPAMPLWHPKGARPSGTRSRRCVHGRT